MTPLVTAIVTSYNHAEYLDQRMESLLNQTWDNLEIIVIDDCSTDGSREVLEKYRKNKNVKLLFLERNGGYANACNLGVKISEGKYVMFAECDDFNVPEHVNTLVNIMENNETLGVAFCKSNIVDQTGRVLGTDYDVREKSFKALCKKDVLIPAERMSKFFLFSCVIPNMSAALIRKKAIEVNGGLSVDFLACADWDFWCRLAQNYAFFYVSEPMNYFRTHQTTVRNKASVALQVGEYYDLLYPAFYRVKLSFSEAIRFRLMCGFFWAHFIEINPLDWFRSFPLVLKRSFKHDRISLFYMLVGLTLKAGRMIQRKLSK